MVSTKRYLELFAILAAIALACAPICHAEEGSDGSGGDDNGSDSGEGGNDSGDDHDNEREVEMEASASEVTFKSRGRLNGQETELEFELDAGSDDYQIEVRVKNQNAIEESDARVRFKAHELIDFTDANGDGYYQDGEENTIHNLKDDGWDAIECTSSATLYNCTTTHSVLPVQFRAMVGGQLFQVGNLTVNPSTIKFDFVVENGFPYANASSSRLALTALLQVRTQVEQQNGVEEDAVKIGEVAQFSWENFASNAAGEHIPILTSSLSDDGEDAAGDHSYGMVFSFDAVAPDYLLWDPAVASTYNPTTSDASITGVGAWYALVACLASLAVVLLA